MYPCAGWERVGNDMPGTTKTIFDNMYSSRATNLVLRHLGIPLLLARLQYKLATLY